MVKTTIWTTFIKMDAADKETRAFNDPVQNALVAGEKGSQRFGI